jgi:hypothetical protein
MRTWTQIGVGCGAVAALASVALVLVAPTLVREARHIVGPIGRMKRSQTALDDMVEKSPWKRPDTTVLTAGQVDRFFAVRRRVDEARRHSSLDLDRLPRKRVRSLEELRQVPGVSQGVSDVVGVEMDAFVLARMTPAEYHWVERIVYEQWRGPLRRAGTYPFAARAAAAEIYGAAAHERDPRVRTRLEAVAADLRQRVPEPPDGIDSATHALLLSRMDEIERWSLDDLAAPFVTVPR